LRKRRNAFAYIGDARQGDAMKVAIMQPYFLPYIGYFQLIKSSDIFVVYDNIQYTKGGWINRNRYLLNGKDAYFGIDVKHDSYFLDVVERRVAHDFNAKKLLNKLEAAYRAAPHFQQGFSLLRESMCSREDNLFRFIKHSIDKVVERLEISTRIVVSSDIGVDHRLKAQDKVLAICRALNATTYINAIGGVELYSKEVFEESGFELKFIKPRLVEYRQFDNEFVPWLSIIDPLMFNHVDTVKSMLDAYDLI
jgi:WbqC-like protein family